MDEKIKQLYWIGSSKKDLKVMPEYVQDIFGYALHLAQQGYIDLIHQWLIVAREHAKGEL